MCDLLHIKTDRGAMIGDDQSGLSISGKPIYHFVVTSIFNGYAVIHFGYVAKINLEYPLAKVCVLSCGILTGLDATFNVTRPLKGFTVVISVLVTVALVAAQGDRLAGASHIIGVDFNPNKFDLCKNFFGLSLESNIRSSVHLV
ncbi:alcohol dehydrogenase I [Carex littledalei]|uniref:alcohol dehydrogenase n=1 Tax=Carex littledalei TaxID=544730 RepID=A0A833VEC1_9POAL|nr:alcohol dehydrogenase I [Carex littledalei]